MGLLSEYVWKGEYKYYDTPDGEDCFKKMLYVTKYTGAYGLVFSSLDVILNSKPQGIGPILGRYVFITVPLMGMAAGFAGTVCAATNMRKKDDKLNYFLGGFTTGAILGAVNKSVRVGSYAAVIAGGVAALWKDSIENKWYFLVEDAPKTRRDAFTFWSTSLDFSLLKDPGREWKRADEVEGDVSKKC